MSIFHILNLSECIPLWQLVRNKANGFSTKKEVYQSQVSCVSYLNLKRTMHTRKKLISVCPQNLMLERQNKWGKNETKNECIVSLIMFYNNSKSLIFKVLVVYVYFYIEQKCVCELFDSSKRTKIVFITPIFWRYLIWWALRNWRNRNLSNIVYCYGFFKDDNATLILTCRDKLVSYYLSKGFLYFNKLLYLWKMCPWKLKTS